MLQKRKEKLIGTFVLITFLGMVYGFRLLINPNQEGDTQRSVVSLSSCIDGDTIKVKDGSEVYLVRFLAIDTPELRVGDRYAPEPYAEKAADYTCERVKSAKKLEVEWDDLATEDKFGRKLGWIFADDELLQKELLENGFAKVRYIYDDYKYVSELNAIQKQAKKAKVGLWGTN